jgi:hypothetical protein
LVTEQPEWSVILTLYVPPATPDMLLPVPLVLQE